MMLIVMSPPSVPAPQPPRTSIIAALPYESATALPVPDARARHVFLCAFQSDFRHSRPQYSTTSRSTCTQPSCVHVHSWAAEIEKWLEGELKPCIVAPTLSKKDADTKVARFLVSRTEKLLVTR